jgi:hypothetical protein
MTSPDKKAFRGSLIAGFFFFAGGVLLLWAAHRADIHHAVIPGRGQKAPWMYPWQGYLASVLCFAAAALAVVGAFRARKTNNI